MQVQIPALVTIILAILDVGGHVQVPQPYRAVFQESVLQAQSKLDRVLESRSGYLGETRAFEGKRDVFEPTPTVVLHIRDQHQVG